MGSNIASVVLILLYVVLIIYNKFIDIDVAAPCLCLVESICRFDSCYLHQNRFPGHSLCYIDDIAFLGAPAAVMVAVIAVFVTAAVPAADFAQDNYVAR
jgi:hypothetical protein